MATSNDINTGGIDTAYPVAGQDNDSQGFRDNFSNIKQAVDDAKSAIATLEGTSPSTQADNDFNDNTIAKAILRDTGFAAPSAETLSGETNVDFTAGHYRRLICTSEVTDPTSTNTVVIQNWGPANSMGHMTLEVRSNNANEKKLNFSTPSGNILTDKTNLNLSADFALSDDGTADGTGSIADFANKKWIFEVWSPDQGSNIFIYYKGKFTI